MSLYYSLIYIMIFVYGIVIGSFLNVCIYRIPKGESIVTVGSHCMKCNHKLKCYDLFPLFSFLFLRGKCRYCGTKLSAQYPVIEGTNGILYVLIFLVHGWNIESILFCLLSSTLLVLSMIDYRTMEIPFGINLVIGVIGIVHLMLDYTHWTNYLIGFFAVSGLLLICYLVTHGRGIGGGDIKLMAVAGLCLGWKNILLALVIGCLIGSVIQVAKMVITKEGRMFAFGPYLSIGIFIAMLGGNLFYEWYLGLIL